VANRWRFRGILALASLAIVPTTSQAQIQLPEGASARLSGRVHTQFNTTSVSGERSTDFSIRRARLSLDVRLNQWISGKVEPDFGEGAITLKDAYLRLTIGPEFQAEFGQFKRPFDLFELTSSSSMLVVERVGGVRGVDACSGPGGTCSFSRFTEKLGYSDRDIGVRINGSLAAGRVSYAGSVTNGTGANVADENGNKSFTGRLSVELVDGVVVSANTGAHDYIHPTSSVDRYAYAFGGDVEIGTFSRGLHIQAGVVAGDNWKNPVGDQEEAKFVTAQGIVTYRLPVSAGPISAVEPVARVSWGDPDTATDDDHGMLLTPGLMLHFSGRNKLGANMDIWSPSVGTTEWSLKVQSSFYF
jgi:hypothetical protein